MDAASKRLLWAAIKRRTADCCTILTTHSMEECEALCGRICVMTAGAMRTLGPLLALKNMYGLGLRIDFRQSADASATAPAALLAFLVRRCDRLHFAASVDQERPGSLSVMVAPKGSDDELPMGRLFDALAVTDKPPLGVREFSLIPTSLEEVFLSLARRGPHADVWL